MIVTLTTFQTRDDPATPTEIENDGIITCDATNLPPVGPGTYYDRWYKFDVTATTPPFGLMGITWVQVPYWSLALYSGSPSGSCDSPISGMTFMDCSSGTEPGGDRDMGKSSTPVSGRLNCNNLAPGTYYIPRMAMGWRWNTKRCEFYNVYRIRNSYWR